MTFRIRNAEGVPLTVGSTSFTYRGYVVTMIAMANTPMVTISDRSNILHKIDGEDVESAILWITNQFYS